MTAPPARGRPLGHQQGRHKSTRPDRRGEISKCAATLNQKSSCSGGKGTDGRRREGTSWEGEISGSRVGARAGALPTLNRALKSFYFTIRKYTSIKRTGPVRDVNGEGGCVWWGGRGYVGTLYFLLDFAMSLKLLFQKSRLKKKKEEQRRDKEGGMP